MKKVICSALVLSSLVCFSQLPKASIEILPDSIAKLENNPFLGEDVTGNFIGADDIRRDQVEINYRGSYQLKNLMDWLNVPQRNWKVKVGKDAIYRDRREWNYNFEVHPRQVLAYYLMNKAGVAVPFCRQILFSVNDVPQGLYVEYEDPDNKDWLKDKFGDNDGDLYKAATDIPDQPRFFAGMNDLGDQNEDYFGHYNKKTNHKDAGEGDYSTLIQLIKMINDTPDAEFVSTLDAQFDTQSFIQYLVVANFISHWDSYPVRPKNYWLYNNPQDNKWVFIPWDLDATFQRNTTGLNRMGMSASIFYQFDGYEEYDLQPQEGKERTLVTRMMKIPQYRNAYVKAYQDALDTYLKESVLVTVLDSLENALKNDIQGATLSKYQNETSDVKSFIKVKSRSVQQEVDNYQIREVTDVDDTDPNTSLLLHIYPNPAADSFLLDFSTSQSGRYEFQLVDLLGKTVKKFEPIFIGSELWKQPFSTDGISTGTYLFVINNKERSWTKKVVIR